MFIKGKTDISLWLQDKSGKSFICDKKIIPAGEWEHVYFNIQASLNPTNFWVKRYDKNEISKIKIKIPKRSGDIYLDSISITE
jgi:hypothetical protein